MRVARCACEAQIDAQQNRKSVRRHGDDVERKRRNYRVVAEVGSAIAVVVSLVFVGLEVQETAEQTALNTVSLQVAVYQELIGQIGEWNRTLLDPDIAELLTRIQDPQGEWSQFSRAEERRARSLLFLLFRHADMAFYQFEQGMLPEARLRSALVPFFANLARPMVRQHWEQSKTNFVPSFHAYVEQQLATSR